MNKRVTVSKSLGQNDIGLGGPGSGNWGHKGRPGKIGGSAPRSAGMSIKTGKTWLQRYQKAAGHEHAYAAHMRAWREEQKKRGKPKDGADAVQRVLQLDKDFQEELKGVILRRELAQDQAVFWCERVEARRDELLAQGKTPDQIKRDSHHAVLVDQYREQGAKVAEARLEASKIKAKYAKAIYELLTVDDSVGVYPQLIKQWDKNDPRLKEIEEGMGFINMVVPRSARPAEDVVVFRKGGRGRSSCGNSVNLTTRANARTVVHEVGHWLEDNCPQIRAKVFSFYERRTAGDPLLTMNQATGSRAFRGSERTRKDKFLSAYMGKEYVSRGRRYATEILSMGLEYMHSDPVHLAKQDPEYFAFIYDVLRSK